MPVSSRCQRAGPVLALAVLALLVSGCVHHRHTRAHVHRTHHDRVVTHHDGVITHHDGVVIVFDRSLGCYVVRDHPGHYFFDGRFYSYRDGSWYGASRVAGPWMAARAQALPARLRENYGQRVREAAHEGNAQRHEAIREQSEERHDARMERREAVAESRAEHREDVQERRDERREAVRDQHEERDDARMERREAVAEQRAEDRVERREQVQERRAGHQRVAKERWAGPHPPASAEEVEGPEEAAEAKGPEEAAEKRGAPWWRNLGRSD